MTDARIGTPRIFFCRHGETEWSKTGQHTGISEIPLTAHGTAQVRATGKLVLGPGKLVDPAKLSHVYVSPRRRAQQTAALLCEAVEGEARSRGILDGKMTTEEDLTEWNYGRYEGLRPPEIIEDRKQRGLEREDRSWDIWQDGAEGGESPEQVTERMDRLIGQIKEPHRRLLSGEGSAGSGGADVLLIAHGHILRAFFKRWLGYPLDFPLSMMLDPGAIGVLSYKNRNVDEPAFWIGMAFPTGEGDS